MADKPIAQFTDGATLADTDRLAGARSPYTPNNDVYITGAQIKLAALQINNPDGITVDAATTAALAGSPVYNNNASGVGATLTKGSNGAFPAQDTEPSVLNKTYLIKNQADQTQNGVYKLTDPGGVSTKWELTRKTDSDASAELDNQIIIVGGGSTNLRKVFSQNTPFPAIGTANIRYGQTPANTGVSVKVLGSTAIGLSVATISNDINYTAGCDMGNCMPLYVRLLSNTYVNPAGYLIMIVGSGQNLSNFLLIPAAAWEARAMVFANFQRDLTDFSKYEVHVYDSGGVEIGAPLGANDMQVIIYGIKF